VGLKELYKILKYPQILTIPHYFTIKKERIIKTREKRRNQIWRKHENSIPQ